MYLVVWDSSLIPFEAFDNNLLLLYTHLTHNLTLFLRKQQSHTINKPTIDTQNQSPIKLIIIDPKYPQTGHSTKYISHVTGIQHIYPEVLEQSFQCRATGEELSVVLLFRDLCQVDQTALYRFWEILEWPRESLTCVFDEQQLNVFLWLIFSRKPEEVEVEGQKDEELVPINFEMEKVVERVKDDADDKKILDLLKRYENSIRS